MAEKQPGVVSTPPSLESPLQVPQQQQQQQQKTQSPAVAALLGPANDVKQPGNPQTDEEAKILETLKKNGVTPQSLSTSLQTYEQVVSKAAEQQAKIAKLEQQMASRNAWYAADVKPKIDEIISYLGSTNKFTQEQLKNMATKWQNPENAEDFKVMYQLYGHHEPPGFEIQKRRKLEEAPNKWPLSAPTPLSSKQELSIAASQEPMNGGNSMIVGLAEFVRYMADFTGGKHDSQLAATFATAGPQSQGTFDTATGKFVSGTQ